MRLRNETTWPDWFLRRMIGWVCRQRAIQHRVRDIEEARFRLVPYQNRGKAWFFERRFLVNLRPRSNWKVRIRSAVFITAHEIGHLAQGFRVFLSDHSEHDADQREARVYRSFLAHEDRLVERWMSPPGRME